MRYVRYLNRELPLDLPARNLAFEASPLMVPPAPDPRTTLLRALSAPIDAAPLHELTARENVVLIVDDNTRATPVCDIALLVLEELNRAGIPDRRMRAVIASGTHRPMTTAEKRAKYGVELLARIPFLDHNCKDPAGLVDLGLSPRGTRILVNREVMEADFRISIGSIIPHYPMGWSGGAKTVLPGVAGEATVAQLHFLGCRYPGLGQVETPMRQEMEHYAAQIGLDFIVNVILNREGLIVDAVAGHYIYAHRAGVEISQSVYGVPIPEQADLVISSTSPVEFDLFQADKGLFAADPVTRPGGEIVLVAGCVEGISPAHPELAEYGRLPNSQIWGRVARGGAADPLTAAEALMLNDLKERVRVTLATDGLSPEVCRELGFGYVRPDRLAAYLSQRLAAQPELRVGILHHSADLLPRLQAPDLTPQTQPWSLSEAQ